MIIDTIQEELKKIFEIDQENNSKYSKKEITIEKLIELQDINFKDFNKIIIENGFPFKDIVGDESYKQAVTIALHSNPKNMRIYESIFSKIEDTSKIDLADKAYFIDKLRLMEKRPQVYGTQYTKKSDGTISFKEIEDIENVNVKRNNLGIGTLEEYKKFAEGR